MLDRAGHRDLQRHRRRLQRGGRRRGGQREDAVLAGRRWRLVRGFGCNHDLRLFLVPRGLHRARTGGHERRLQRRPRPERSEHRAGAARGVRRIRQRLLDGRRRRVRRGPRWRWSHGFQLLRLLGGSLPSQ